MIEAFWTALMERARRDGVVPVSRLSGCWELDLGDWKLALNGHREPVASSLSPEPVHPFTVYAEWCGWPAGVITPTGMVIAAGSEANLASLISALAGAGEGGGAP